MGKFTAIPKDTFDALQLDAGVLLNTFNPASIAAPQDATLSAPLLAASTPLAFLHSPTWARTLTTARSTPKS